MFKSAPISSRNQFGAMLNAMGLTGFAVEVGTHRGDFADALLRHWKGTRLLCVDPWMNPAGFEEQAKLLWGGGPDGQLRGSRQDDYLECKSRLARHEGRFELVRATSVDAAETVIDGSLDFAYIDGDHRFEHVLADLQSWWMKLKSGGVLAGHDWVQPGEAHRWAEQVQQAMAEFVSGYDAYINGVDVFLVVEEGGLPWSYYLVKP